MKAELDISSVLKRMLMRKMKGFASQTHGVEDRETGGQLYSGVRVALSDLLNQTGRALKQEYYCVLSCGVIKNKPYHSPLAGTACALRDVYTNECSQSCFHG